MASGVENEFMTCRSSEMVERERGGNFGNASNVAFSDGSRAGAHEEDMLEV